MTRDRAGEKSSEDIHRTVARTAGAMALQLERRTASRWQIEQWVVQLRGAADDLERRLQPQKERRA